MELANRHEIVSHNGGRYRDVKGNQILIVQLHSVLGNSTGVGNQINWTLTYLMMEKQRHGDGVGNKITENE